MISPPFLPVPIDTQEATRDPLINTNENTRTTMPMILSKALSTQQLRQCVEEGNIDELASLEHARRKRRMLRTRD
jgi:hypothetical protein